MQALELNLLSEYYNKTIPDILKCIENVLNSENEISRDEFIKEIIRRKVGGCKNWDVIGELGSGFEKTLFFVENKNKKLKSQDERYGVLSFGKTLREVNIYKKLDELDIGPKIYDLPKECDIEMYKFGNYFWMILEHFDGDIQKLLYDIETDINIFEYVVKECLQIILKLGKNDIDHQDTKIANFLYKHAYNRPDDISKNIEIKITDPGPSAVMGPSKYLSEILYKSIFLFVESYFSPDGFGKGVIRIYKKSDLSDHIKGLNIRNVQNLKPKYDNIKKKILEKNIIFLKAVVNFLRESTNPKNGIMVQLKKTYENDIAFYEKYYKKIELDPSQYYSYTSKFDLL